MTLPGLTPPPAKRMLWACDQWSRPAAPLTRGVRPISPIITTRVFLSRPRCSRSLTRALKARSTWGSMSFWRLGEDRRMVVPAAVVDADKAAARFHQPAGQQGALAQARVAVGLADYLGF